MSVLKKIRENVGLVVVVIAISLFSFIFTSLIQNIGKGNDRTVGEINGSSVSYEALAAEEDKEQRLNPQATDEDAQYMRRQQSWQTLVQDQIFLKELDAAGININDEEVRMIYNGRLYHPLVMQSGFFVDSTGNFNPRVVQNALSQADEIDENDPNNFSDEARNFKRLILNIDETVRLDRRKSKWQVLVKNSAYLSDNEVKRAYEQNARAADISYVYVPYTSIPDEQLQVSDAERSEYYNNHREAYRREDEVRLKYVYFKADPSRLDTIDAVESSKKIMGEFKVAENVWLFSAENSDEPVLFIDTTLKPIGKLPLTLQALNGRTDTVIGPMVGLKGIDVMRIVRVKEDSANANVHLRHVLVSLKGNTAVDSADALKKANDIAAELNADKTKWTTVALEKSDDGATKDKGGDLDWQAENFFGEESAKDIKAHGVGPVFVTKLEKDGYHVVEILDRSNKLYSFATITRHITASQVTNDSVFQRASMMHGNVIAGMSIDSALTKYPEARDNNSGNVPPGTFNLLGVKGARPVITWAFKHQTGDVCENVITVQDAYVIAKIEYKGDKGYSSVDDLKGNVEFETAVKNSVRAKQIKAKLEGASGDLQAIATAYGAAATVGSAKELHFASSEVQGLGVEPRVVGRAFGMAKNEVSKPIKGNMGVFVIKLDDIREPAPIDDMNKMIQRMTLSQGLGDKVVQTLFGGMREIANIRDLRYDADL